MAEPAYNREQTLSDSGNEVYTAPANTNAAPVSRVSGVRKEYRKKNNTTATAGQVGGAAVEGTGAVIQGASKVTGAASKGVTRAGAALSSTGVGAIVGVPMMAVGGAGSAVSKGGESVGRGIRKTGRSTRRASTKLKRSARARGHVSTRQLSPQQRMLNQNRMIRQTRAVNIDAPPSKKELKARLKIPSMILQVAGWGVGVIVAIFNSLFILFFAAYSSVEVAGWLAPFLSFGRAAIFRDTGAAAQGSAEFAYLIAPEKFMSWMAIAWFIGFIVAAIFLFVAYRVMEGRGAHGRNSAIKESLFLAALVGCFIPFANIWPWTNHWVKHVAKHPE